MNILHLDSAITGEASVSRKLTADIVAALKTVNDPEIPADIYELGLIYKVDLDDGTTSVVAAIDVNGYPMEPEELEDMETESGLSTVLDNIDFTGLSDEQLAVSGITRTETGYRIPVRQD